MNEYMDDLITQVKSRLSEYITSHGRRINTNGSFQCFNTSGHRHGDADFSANISKTSGIELWNCHVCKTGGTIYDLARDIEGMPDRGEGFVQTTIELATRFGIPVDTGKLPSSAGKSASCYNMKELYREIEDYIRTNGNGIEHLTSGEFGRTYSEEQAKQIMEFLTVGCIESSDLTAHMRKKFGDQILDLPFYEEDRKMFQPSLFNLNRLVMPVRNRSGIPVAFCGRVKGDSSSIEKGTPKYIHSRGFEGLKKQSMFLIDAAKEHIKKTRKVRFVEGQFDAISMHLFGYKNTVSLLGSSIPQEVVDQLSAFKIYGMTFILDPDKAGISGLKKALEDIETYDITVDAVLLPEHTDPDKLMRTGDADLINKTEDAVKLVLNHYWEFHDDTIPKDTRYNKMLKFISDCSPHSAKYREYARILAETFGYHEDDIVYNLQDYNNNNRTIGDEEKRINLALTAALNKPIIDKIAIMEDSVEKLRALHSDIDKANTRTTWQDFMSLVNGDEKFPKILRTGYRLDRFADIECGALTFVSGWPSNGKSSVLQHLGITMARKNRDLKILYVATDDVPRKAMASFLGIITGLPKKDVRQMIETGQFLGSPQVDARFDEIRDLFNNQIILKGLKDCSSTDKIKQEISNIRRVHSKDLLVVVDAMNNLDDIKKDDQRVGIENAIRNFKNMAVTYDAALIPVSHLTKQDGKEGERPRLKNLKGTSFIEYEAKTVLLVHMDAHYNKATQLRWRCGASMFPIVEINVAKDKDQEANSIVPVHFNPLTGEIINPTDMEHDRYVKIIEGAANSNAGGDSLFDS